MSEESLTVWLGLLNLIPIPADATIIESIFPLLIYPAFSLCAKSANLSK